MRRWIVAAIVAVVVGLVPCVHQTAAPVLAAQSQSQKQDPQTITVYVTRPGAKYHRDRCRHLSRSRIPMSLSEAAKRYGPCSVCKPPVLPEANADGAQPVVGLHPLDGVQAVLIVASTSLHGR